MKLFFNPSLKSKTFKKDYDENLIVKRLFLVAFSMTVFGLIIFSKIVELAFFHDKQVIKNSSLVTKEKDPFRGNIKDRNDKILASNIFNYKLKAYPKFISDPLFTAEILVKIFPGMDKKKIISQISNKSKYEIIIARNVTAKKAKQLNDLGIPGLEFFSSVKRFYPHGNLASHLVGHTNSKLIGVNGLERTYDKALSSGEDIKISLDIRVQHAIREELLKDKIAFKAKTATAILTDIKNNQVFAMVSLPDYNPNLSINPSNESYRNTATFNLYEMGSTFKVFSVAAAFELANLGLSNNFDARKPLRVAQYLIKDYHPQNRILSTREIFLKSSNIGASLIGLKIGGANLKSFYTNLGLLNYSTINIREKSKPKYPKKWGEIETATLSFGHGISITPMNLVEAASLVFGKYKYEKVNLQLNKNIEKKEATFISENTKEKLLQLMKENVLYGTGKNAFVDGYDVGGKTATAEKVNLEKGGYDKRKLVSSFLSVFPTNDPSYILFVLYDEPFLDQTSTDKESATGGKTAAKTTSRIIKRVAPILGIEKKSVITDHLLTNKKNKGIDYVSF